MIDDKRADEYAKADNENEGGNSNSTGFILSEFVMLRGNIETPIDIPIAELYQTVHHLTVDNAERAASFIKFLRILTDGDEDMHGVVLEIALKFAFMQAAEYNATFHCYLSRFLTSESADKI